MLTPEQQEAIRRQGGLGNNNPSAMLVSRIRKRWGWVLVDGDEKETMVLAPCGRKGEGKDSALAPYGRKGEGKVSAWSADRDEEETKVVGPYGRKGEGKRASLGVALPHYDAATEVLKTPEEVPTPKKYSSQEVEKLLNGDYYRNPDTPFWTGGSDRTLKKGTHVIWKGGAKTGPRGGPSTKVEYFHGMVDGWKGEKVILH